MIYSFSIYETYLHPESIDRPVKSSWHLTKITSPTNEEVTFQYQTTNNLYTKSVGDFIEIRNVNTHYTHNGCSKKSEPPAQVYKTVSGKQYSQVRLDAINFTNGKVEFAYSDREDIENDAKLDHIKVFQKLNGTVQNAPFKEFVFTYDYFTSRGGANFNEDNPYVYKRLKLLSVQEKGNAIHTPPYTFKYYENVSLPAKSSFAKDHWGYYNGKGGNTSLIPNFKARNSSASETVFTSLGIMGKERNTVPYYISANSLKEIIYPTGGSTEFKYEANDYNPKISSAGSNREPESYEKTKRLVYKAQYKGTIYEEELDIRDMFLNREGKYALTTLKASIRVKNDCSSIQGTPNVYFELYRENGNRVSLVSMELPRCAETSSEQCFNCDGPELTYTNSYNLEPGKYIWKAFIADDHNTSEFLDIFVDYTYEAEYGSIYNNDPRYAFAGGQRIRQIIDKDNISKANNKIRSFEYRYFEDSNNDGIEEEYSNGILMVQPSYSYFEEESKIVDIGPPQKPIIVVCGYSYLMRSSNSNSLNSSANGTIVGYSQVTELHGEEGRFGKTVYTYDNKPDRVYNYEKPSEVFTSKVFLRPPYKSTLEYEKNGLLLNQTTYRKEGEDYKKVQETINQYSIPHTANHTNVYYGIDIRERRSSGVVANQCPNILIYPALQSNLVNLTSTKERIYDKNDENKFVETSVDYKYEYPNHLQVAQKSITNSDGKVVVEHYKYPLDYEPSLRSPVINALINKHRHNVVIEKTSSVDDTLISARATQYKHDIGYSFSQDGYTFNTNLVDRLIYHKYDNKGNLLEYSKKGGAHTVYLWGYNQTYPVSKIMNTTYSEIEALSGFGVNFDLGTTGLTATQEHTLRTATSLSNSAISTFTYTPLVGMTSATNPQKYTMHYYYDTLNRLKEIKDQEDNLIQDYIYHYKNNE
jgi:hypothetical protein